MARTESTIQKLLPLLLLGITTIASSVLIALRSQRNIGSFNKFVATNRDSTALMVQVLASILGLCQVYAVCSTINFTTRLYFERNSIPLQTLNFWSAIVTPRLDFSLLKRHFVSLVFWCSVTSVPGALWAGALTPLFVPLYKDVGTVLVPTYPSEASDYWDNEFIRYKDGKVTRMMKCKKTTDLDRYQNWTGPFISSCPDLDFIPALTASIGSATKPSSSSPWVHSNLINPEWSFIGRSYGVGSSPGLIDPSETTPVPYSAYNYTELGYMTNVTCTQNKSAAYGLKYMGDYGPNAARLALWLANGTLPNSVPGRFEFYQLATYTGRKDLFAWSSVVNKGQNYVAIATSGDWYETWNNTQCSVEFQPSLFSVAANLTSKTITVNRLPHLPGRDIAVLETTGNLTANVMLGLDRLSREDNNFDVSSLGNPITWNVVNVRRSYSHLTDAQANIRGAEDSITALLDNLLFAYGPVELVLANATTNASKQTPFSGFYSTLRIGSDKYIFAVFGTNIGLLFLFVVEMGRTKFWKGLTRFNYTDIKRVIIATSAGGNDIANICSNLNSQHSANEKKSKGELKADTGPVLVKLVKNETGEELTSGGEYRRL